MTNETIQVKNFGLDSVLGVANPAGGVRAIIENEMVCPTCVGSPAMVNSCGLPQQCP